MHVHARAVLALQLLEGSFGVGVHRKYGSADVRLGATCRETFDLANRHASPSHPASDGEAGQGIVDGQKCAGVARGDAAFFKQVLDWLFELEQPDGVRDCGSVLAGAGGDLFLREMKLVNQALEGMRLFYWVEILPLEVFHQRHLQRHFFRDVAHYDGYTKQTRALGG